MLEIRTGLGNFVLDPNTRIRFTYLFPLFVIDSIPGVVTYAFDLPDDAEGINSRLLAASTYFDVAKKYRKLSVSIIFAGDEFDSGVLIVTGSKNKKFRCTFLSTPFADNFADLELQKIAGLLSPINLGNTTDEIIVKAKELSQKSYPDSDICFPTIYAPNFYGDTNPDFYGILNAYYFDYIINDINKVWETGDPEEGDYETNSQALLPAFYCRSIIREIFKSQNFIIKGGFFQSQVTKNAVVLGLKAADRTDKLWVFNGAHTGYYDEGTLRILMFGNHTIGSGFSYDTTNGKVLDASAKGYYDVIGENLKFQYVSGERILYVNIFYSHIGGTVNVTQLSISSSEDIVTVGSILGSFYIDNILQIGIFIACNQNYIPIDGTIDIKGTSKNALNTFAKSVSIGEYFSGITVSTMVNAIRSLFGLLFFIDKKRNVVEVELACDVINNSKLIDITGLIISEPDKDFTDRKKYTIDYDWGDTDLMTPLAEQTREIVIANPFQLPAAKLDYSLKILNLYRYYLSKKLEDHSIIWEPTRTFIKNKITPGLEPEEYKILMQTLIGYHMFDGLIIPYLPGEGKSDVFGVNNEMKLTVLAYHGFNGSYKNPFLISPYPYSSLGNLKNDGEVDSTIQSLRLDDDDPDNLYNRALKPMLDFVGNHETITVDIHPSLENINTILKVFRPSTEGEAQSPRRVIVQGVEMFVKQFDFELTNNAVIAAQVKLAKRNHEF